MSRHEIRPRDPGHKVIVGWDPPLQTFYAQVINRRSEKRHSDPKFILWLGCQMNEFPDIESLRHRLRDFAYLSTEIRAKLRADKEADAA